MRKDLNKLLCERERHRHADKYGYYRHDKFFKDFDQFEEDGLDEPFQCVGSSRREPMKARHSSKSFNENLNPLYRFIHKAVGRKWDDVYSEICQVFDKRSVINQHILIHLFQYVEIKDIRVDEEGDLWWVPTNYAWQAASRLEDSHVEYYVDPRDGILKHNDYRKTQRQRSRLAAEKYAAEQAKKERKIDDNTKLEKINGCWFEVKFVENRAEKIRVQLENAFGKVFVDKVVFYAPTGERVSEPKTYLGQRQLSHKELKKYGVQND